MKALILEPRNEEYIDAEDSNEARQGNRTKRKKEEEKQNGKRKTSYKIPVKNTTPTANFFLTGKHRSATAFIGNTNKYKSMPSPTADHGDA
ncbi:predicted protein [Botrytis cinerea T4]|uniref:Uncharacterized protein n=1 Tax=Botryotinia fuckeliana (strain T4) TaxID=999810 RepID=G2YBZ2_BOTF4|nr:predicted protein [Botrytis cinerea T4]